MAAMDYTLIIALAAVFSTSTLVSGDAPGYGYPAPAPSYHHPAPAYKPKGMPYNFAYGVDDHTGSFSHNEGSDGNEVVGEYRVVLPDGRTQIVSYTADHYKGYVAKVSYEGEARYPPPAPYKPSYGPPKPYYDETAPQPYFAEE